MGNIINGNVSMIQYDVQGAEFLNTPEFFASCGDRIKSHAFQDIDDNLEEWSLGWVSVLDMFDSEFVGESYTAGDKVVLTLRLDERKVPGAALKKFIAKEVRKVMKEREIPRLSRTMKLEIKERITAEMTRKAPPVPLVADMVWLVEERIVYLLSVTQKPVELFEDLFHETFGVRIVQTVPYTMAQHILGGDEMIQTLKPSTIL